MKGRAYASGKYVSTQASKAEAFGELQLKPSFRVATIFDLCRRRRGIIREYGNLAKPKKSRGVQA